MSRPSWDEYFIEITQLVAKRSTCLRRQVGAVIAKDKNIVATGYNGSPAGTAHCEDIGCLRQQMGIPSGEKLDWCRAAHAEQNAICQAAKHGNSIDGATMYVSNLPCGICGKLLINCGIRRVVFFEGYADERGLAMFQEAGVEVVRWEKERLS